MIVDVHVHPPLPEWIEDGVGPYLESAERYFRKKVTAKPMEDLAAEYEALDMVGVLLAWDAETFTGRPPLPDETIAGIVERFPDRFVGFGCADPHKFAAAEQVAANVEAGSWQLSTEQVEEISQLVTG